MARRRTEITIHQKAKICAIKESKKMSARRIVLNYQKRIRAGPRNFYVIRNFEK